MNIYEIFLHERTSSTVIYNLTSVSVFIYITNASQTRYDGVKDQILFIKAFTLGVFCGFPCGCDDDDDEQNPS